MRSHAFPLAVSEADTFTLARTIWGEARGESMRGRLAVAHVVLNRLARPGWWSRHEGDGIPDDTIQAVCRDPYQFSCWNATDVNRAKLLDVGFDDAAFRECFAIACLATTGAEGFRDPTAGATHYHHRDIAPSWAAKMVTRCEIGPHVFLAEG